MTFEVHAHPESASVVFSVHLQPRACRSEIAGIYDRALKIRVQAPAIDNRANEELCAFLAALLKRPKSAVRLLSGEQGRNKRVEISGVTAAEVRALIQHEA